MDTVAHTGPLRAGATVLTPHARLVVAGPASAPPPACDVHFLLADGARAAYSPLPEGAGDAREVEADPTLRGNAFRALHEGARSLAACVSVAAGRRMESGPQSERIFVFLRGSGLVFLENGDTMRFGVGDASVVPAGEAVRVWAQGPDDVLLVVLQPRMAAQPKRTLAGEIARRRQESPGGAESS